MSGGISRLPPMKAINVHVCMQILLSLDEDHPYTLVKKMVPNNRYYVQNFSFTNVKFAIFWLKSDKAVAENMIFVFTTRHWNLQVSFTIRHHNHVTCVALGQPVWKCSLMRIS